MIRYFYILILTLGTAVGLAGQTPTPTVTPAPSPTPLVNDVQGVTPDTLQNVPAIAPNYRSDDRRFPDLGRVGVDSADVLSMTMKDVLERALEANKDIEISRKTETMAEFDLKAARGFYEPHLTGQTYYDRTTTPNLSIFSTNTTTTQGTILGNAALQGYVPKFGTILTGSLNNTRVTSNNPITILSPQLNSSLSFAVTQPLFRGRKFDQPRRTIEIAKRNIALTDTQFRQRSIEVVASAQRAYWDLAYALRNLQVQRDSVRDAKSQLEHNKRLVNEGQLAPIDVVAAETQVANFEQAVYDALNLVNSAENALKNLIAPNRADTIWSKSITPVEPVEQALPNQTLGEALDTALQSRPELQINQFQKDINAIDQRFFREQKKPQIDLVASYSSAGVGGSQNPAFNNPFARTTCLVPTSPECLALVAQQQTFLNQIGGAATAYSDIFQNKYPTLRVGVQFNFPLFGDRTSSAQLGKAKVEAERIDVQREQIEQGIQVEVRNALQSIRTGEARLRSAAIVRENTERQYESEQRKLEDGQSDVYRVLERQTAVSVARSNELRARTELNKAIADLQRATGSSLKANGIETKLKK